MCFRSPCKRFSGRTLSSVTATPGAGSTCKSLWGRKTGRFMQGDEGIKCVTKVFFEMIGLLFMINALEEESRRCIYDQVSSSFRPSIPGIS